MSQLNLVLARIAHDSIRVVISADISSLYGPGTYIKDIHYESFQQWLEERRNGALLCIHLPQLCWLRYGWARTSMASTGKDQELGCASSPSLLARTGHMAGDFTAPSPPDPLTAADRSHSLDPCVSLLHQELGVGVDKWCWGVERGKGWAGLGWACTAVGSAPPHPASVSHCMGPTHCTNTGPGPHIGGSALQPT